MNYQLHYDRLIDRAKGRNIGGYSERHHINPSCLGGPDDASNIVRLTPEEHYVAHQLLVKMHPGSSGLLWAAVCMTSGSKKQSRSNKLYGWLRRKFAALMSEAEALARDDQEDSREQCQGGHFC